jgi:diguanylate cyclase (GGDEF)-like protein/PAS domain S-box-containing protein
MKVVPRDRVTVFERLLRSMPGTVLPPSVLIDADLTVRHTFGDVSNWVRLGEGEFSTDLYRLAVRPLRVEVRSLIMKAQRDAKGFVEHVVSGRELERPVRISVLRLEEENGQPSMLLVSFRATRTKPARQSDQVERDAEHLTEVTQLEQQLASTREHLHTVIEELETSNEELQSLNEEMQSSNEELTSANEELETANEELQSTNEELTTVNEELENKTQEFAALNNDLLNVKNSLPHPVIVIDVRSRIMLFNDGAGEAFRLPEDSIGESLFAMPGIAMLGDLGDLAIDTRRVLESGETVERQIEGQRTGLLISSPYRGNDGERNGVVLMFIDNSRLRAAERSLALAHDQLRNAERFARETIDALPQAVCVIDSACRIVSVNRLWTSMMQAGGGSEDLCGVGADYGAVCARAASAGEDTAAAFLAGLRAMVAGTLDRFEKEYPCLTPSGMRWFIASITRFSELERRFWLVMHIEITERKVQERTILMQSLALDANTAGVFIADTGLPQLPIVYVNRAFETVTAMTRDQLIGRDFTSLFPAATTPLREAVEGGVDARFTVTLESGAEPRHAELAVRPIALGPGERAHFSGVVHDVTERVRSADALRLTLQREALALSFAEIGSFDWNVRSGSLKCSALQMQLLGLGNEEGTVEQAEFLGLVHPDDLRAFNDVLRFCIAGHSPFNLDYRVIWPDGSTHWLRSRGNSTTDANSAPVSVLCLTQDITSAKESEMRARFLAHHDPLTGLANRSLLEDRLQQAISGARRERRRVALVFLDLDRFKEINDVFGHHAGDELLKRVAERLQSSVRQTDSVCRHSGDEFIVLLPGIHDAEEAGRIAGKIQNTLRKPYSIAGRDLHVSGSMGIAIYPDDGESADVLIKNADAAMYQSKGTGRDSFEFFSPNMNAQLVRRIETARQLRNCIVDAQLELDYQPQIDIVTGDLVGIEALVRWRHPERGLLLPDEFIPHAEDADLIHEIGNWVIERACRQNLAWHAQGVSRVPVAVNVSPAQFRKSDFIDRLTAILGKTGLDPSLLELEITERLLMHHTDAATEVLGRCHALGVRLSIDDFGTGYSSLTYLQRFPMDRIKIDRSFVAAATQQKVAAAIVRAVIHLGRGLGQQIVAEGVETLDQLALLRSEGCDAFQGYLCTRPLPAEALGTFILDKLPVSWREARHA